MTVVYRFGPFTLDPASFRLSREGAVVPLTPKALEILVLLLRERRRGLTKQELLDTVWADTSVTENTLTQRIKEIREALGDSPQESVYLRTISRIGYQFVGEVTELSSHPDDPVSEAVPTGEVAANAAGVSAPAPGGRRRRFWRAAILLPVAVLLGVAAVLSSRARPGHPGTRPDSTGEGRVMLVVLPFENLSSDPEQEYFSDGLTEEMIAELGRLDPARLGVIARTSSMTYKETPKSIATIAAELDVDYILEGSVRREADRVRIVAQLVRAQDQTQIWAERYDRELQSILTVQGEVARSIAAMTRVQLSESGQERLGEGRTVDSDAYQMYLKGRFFLGQRTRGAIEKGLEHFRYAVVADPTYAPAHAGLADAYELSATYAGMPPRDAIERALAAARRARELAPVRSEPYTSLGTICASHTWDWVQCERDFSQALALNANDALAHKGYSEVLSFLGRHDEAIVQAKLAVELDPLSLIMQSNLGASYYRARRFDDALRQMRQTLDMDPNYMLGHFNLGMTLTATGAYDDAVRAFQRARVYDPAFPDSLALLGYAYARMGRRAEATQIARQLRVLSTTQYVSPYVRAIVYAGLADRRQAVMELERAYADRSWLTAMLKVDPVFDTLRGEPRFEQLLQRMSFPNVP